MSNKDNKGQGPHTPEKGDLSSHFCGACGKGAHEVDVLIQGEHSSTCGECVDLMHGLLKEQQGEQPAQTVSGELKTPHEIKAHMDDYVIGQDDAKEILSTAVYNHYVRQQNAGEDADGIEMEKSNILLTGGTGSGKTLMLKTLAKALDVPFAIADATALTASGYVGEDVESVVTKLLQQCEFDIEKAQGGIIYIDEIDKISAKNDPNRVDVGGTEVQQALLKLMEGTVASVAPQGGRKHPNQEFLQVDTSNILFICGGAFSGLEEAVKARMGQNTSAGFTASVEKSTMSNDEAFANIEPGDLQAYGLMPEFIGRLPVIATTKELDTPALIRVLTEPKNALVKQFEKHFKMHGVQLEFTQDSLETIATIAQERGSGARGLRSIMEKALLKTMFNLPKMADEGVNKVTFNGDNIRNGTPPATEHGEPIKATTGPVHSKAAEKHGVEVERKTVHNRQPPGGVCIK